MKESTKRVIAKEIKVNLNIIRWVAIFSVTAMLLFSITIYPSKTHYTPPSGSDYWPESDTGPAMLIPEGYDVNREYVSAYFSNMSELIPEVYAFYDEYVGAYFSNKSKYDDIIFIEVMNRELYEENPTISDVIAKINSARMDFYFDECIKFLIHQFLIWCEICILGRYIFKGMRYVFKGTGYVSRKIRSAYYWFDEYSS